MILTGIDKRGRRITEDISTVQERGYLKENYRLFHLKDSRAQKLSYHYHDFDKIVLLLSGRVSYTVEGKRYFMKPGDILLVQHNMIHKPDIDPKLPYERMILWIDKDHLKHIGGSSADLSACFSLAHERSFHLLRTDRAGQKALLTLFQRLEEADQSRESGHELLRDTYFLQLMLALSRESERDRSDELRETYRYDPKIEDIMRYIETHPAEDLSVEALSGRYYLSRYYLMHRFKEVSGYTLHQYVNQKRLQYACELIHSGESIMKAAELAGFQEYSTFLRVFRNSYHISPRAFQSGEAIERGASLHE